MFSTNNQVLASSLICKSGYYFYQFSALGACLPRNSKVEKEHYPEELIYKITIDSLKIHLEFSGRQVGNIYRDFGSNYARTKLDNLSKVIPHTGDRDVELHQWNRDGKIISASIFGTEYSNVIIIYSADEENIYIGDDFMKSLFFICKKHEDAHRSKFIHALDDDSNIYDE